MFPTRPTLRVARFTPGGFFEAIEILGSLWRRTAPPRSCRDPTHHHRIPFVAEAHPKAIEPRGRLLRGGCALPRGAGAAAAAAGHNRESRREQIGSCAQQRLRRRERTAKSSGVRVPPSWSCSAFVEALLTGRALLGYPRDGAGVPGAQARSSKRRGLVKGGGARRLRSEPPWQAHGGEGAEDIFRGRPPSALLDAPRMVLLWP